ncbi:MAG: hypothetical protein IPN17_37190 [Deltaproteobacteria bacterium]|nr:hypothetical protein [Deltaproteobacteria bacterium]
MDDAALVGVVEGVGELEAEGDGVDGGERRADEAGGEGLAVEELEREEEGRRGGVDGEGGVAVVEEGGDVRVGERGGDGGLALGALAIGGRERGEELQGDGRGVGSGGEAGDVDVGGSTAREVAQEREGADGETGRERG